MGFEPVTSWLRTRGTNHYAIAAEMNQTIISLKIPLCTWKLTLIATELYLSARRSSIGTDYSVCHLAELDDNQLNFYGPGSLEAVDRNWGEKAASSVTFVSFNFITFDSIVPFLSKIKNRFVNVTVSYLYFL